jgi:uncharacterized coiled-coil protein SlyX
VKKWTEERINAHIRYVEEDKDNIEKQRVIIKELEDKITERKNYIERIEKSMYKTIKELAEQDIYL